MRILSFRCCINFCIPWCLVMHELLNPSCNSEFHSSLLEPTCRSSQWDIYQRVGPFNKFTDRSQTNWYSNNTAPAIHHLQKNINSISSPPHSRKFIFSDSRQTSTHLPHSRPSLVFPHSQSSSTLNYHLLSTHLSLESTISNHYHEIFRYLGPSSFRSHMFCFTRKSGGTRERFLFDQKLPQRHNRNRRIERRPQKRIRQKYWHTFNRA